MNKKSKINELSIKMILWQFLSRQFLKSAQTMSVKYLIIHKVDGLTDVTSVSSTRVCCRQRCCVQHPSFSKCLQHVCYTTELTSCYTSKSKEPNGIILEQNGGLFYGLYLCEARGTASLTYKGRLKLMTLTTQRGHWAPRKGIMLWIWTCSFLLQNCQK